MLKQKYFLTGIFILSAERQPIKLAWRKIVWLQNKKEKEITQEELSLIYQEINEAFIEAMQELLEQYPSLTQDDLYYCILNYLQLSNNTIKVCMKAGSQSALTQRKYRIKKQLSDLSFSIIFDAKGESK